MLRLASSVAVALLVVGSSSLQASEWPPVDASQELGLPAETGDVLEVRVWLGGGAVEPSDLYRIIRSSQGVRVERIAWTPIPKETEGLRSAKEAARETREMRAFLSKERCAQSLNETGNYFWCRQPIKRTGPWAVLLSDLLPDELWSLPHTLERKCGWERFDGEIVAIEILEGNRHHSISYANPDFCCPHVACAIANHVRHVVRSEIK